MTRQNKKSLKLNPENSQIISDSVMLRIVRLCLSLCVCMNMCVCVCVSVSVLWRANGRISRSYLPRKLTDELTGSDALFINKDQLSLHWGQHLEQDTRTHPQTDTHCIAEYNHLPSLN